MYTLDLDINANLIDPKRSPGLGASNLLECTIKQLNNLDLIIPSLNFAFASQISTDIERV
jgi:hypothetical protein